MLQNVPMKSVKRQHKAMITMTTVPASSPHHRLFVFDGGIGNCIMLLGLLFTYTKAIGHRAHIVIVYLQWIHTRTHTHTHRSNTHTHTIAISQNAILSCVRAHTVSLVDFSVRYQYIGTYYVGIHSVVRLTGCLSVCTHLAERRHHIKAHSNQIRWPSQCDLRNSFDFLCCAPMLLIVTEMCAMIPKDSQLIRVQAAITMKNKSSFDILYLKCRQSNHCSFFRPFPSSRQIVSNISISIN